MEIREYIEIIKKHIKFFLITISVIVFGVLTYFFSLEDSYETSLTLNVTRSGMQETTDYRYDDFYRLQADERFSDTVVEWLRDPRIVNDIFKNAKLDLKNVSLASLKKEFSVERRSSQIVSVRFSSEDAQVGEKISKSLVEAISERTEKLNENQNEPSWFRIVAEEPLTIKRSFPYDKIFLVSLLAGIFIGFFAVMIRNYLE
jgi:capsular polysaccharide biosynthesis protein